MLKEIRISKRRIAKIFIDVLFIGFAYLLAFQIRFDFQVPEFEYKLMVSTFPMLIIIGFFSLIGFRIYQSRWQYASIKELISIFMAISWASLVLVMVMYFLRIHDMPRSILAINWMLGLLFLGGVRFSYRIFMEFRGYPIGNRCRTLIIGAGNAGEMIIRHMNSDPKLGYYPVGIIDEDREKLNTKIHGVKVFGDLDQLQSVVKKRQAEEIIIATPSANPLEMRKIVQACEKTGIKFKTVPGPKEIVDGTVHLNQVREVKIEDLLDREAIRIDMNRIRSLVNNKVVLITGAAGSIGSELTRQILHLNPQKVVCLDRSENGLFYLERDLIPFIDQSRFEICVADITDDEKLTHIFNRHRPNIIFHTAAYKHVPMMEMHPEEAVRNNIIGTLNTILLADEFNIDKFILISTDKAVNPSSIMGATKRFAEMVLQSYSSQTSMNLIAVRFGNVLASFGSVIPEFQKQIAKRMPVTVTHPEMKRFFMTIPEAVKLILESARMGKGNEIFVLDMGEPIKIVDVAKHLIKLSGFEPDKDIPIQFIGIRPGEKLVEELWNDDEYPKKTNNKKIFMAHGNSHVSWEKMKTHLDDLKSLAVRMRKEKIIDKLAEVVPGYKPHYSMRGEEQISIQNTETVKQSATIRE